MRGWLAVVVLSTGCGRIGFDEAARVDDVGPDSDPAFVAAYVSAVLSDNPIAYWRLESAVVADDSSTFDRDAELDGQVALAQGVVGNAVRFSGGGAGSDGGGQIVPPVAFLFNDRAEFSFECWMYPDALTSTWRQLVETDNWDTLVRRQGYTIEFKDDDIFFARRRDDMADPVAAYDSLVAGRWLHIVATYDGTMARLYIDGAVRANVPSATAIASEVGTPLTVSDAEYTVTGMLDECAFYDAALPAARVTAHYQLGANL